MFPTKTSSYLEAHETIGLDGWRLESAGERAIIVPLDGLEVPGTLIWPEHPSGLVLVSQDRTGAPGPLESAVGRELRRAGLATLHLDLLPDSPEELEIQPEAMAARLRDVTSWATAQAEVRALVPGYLSSGATAAAALQAAAASDPMVRAVVSLVGRPDRAGEALADVRVPTLLLAGSHDEASLEPNRQALRRLGCVKRLIVVQGLSDPLDNPRAWEDAGRWAAGWFVEHLAMAPRWHERRRYRPSMAWSGSPRF